MTDHVTMTIDELEDCAARWGADAARWPERERRAGEDLLAASAEARAALAAFARLEAALGEASEEASPGGMPDGLTARILADAAHVAAERRDATPAASSPRAARGGGLLGFLDRILPAWRPAAACFASAAIGVWLGYLAPESVAEAATQMAAAEAGYGETEVALLGDDLGYSEFGAFE